VNRPHWAAPAGFTWVCTACGKRANHRVDGGISEGWDSSCFSWAVLCEDTSLVIVDGRVVSGRARKEVS
jgi:hypothetical protein